MQNGILKLHDGEPTYSYLEKIFNDISEQNVSLVISRLEVEGVQLILQKVYLSFIK